MLPEVVIGPIFFTPMNPHNVYQSVYSVKKQHASVFTACIELQPWNEQSWSNKMKFNGKYVCWGIDCGLFTSSTIRCRRVPSY